MISPAPLPRRLAIGLIALISCTNGWNSRKYSRQ